MISKNYSSEAIVLSRKNYSEADRILVLYTRAFGKISAMAKGVRKPKSRKRGHIEVFARIKFSATKTMGMDIITEVESIDDYHKIRSDLKLTSVAYFFIETVNKLVREGEKNTQLFEMLADYLDMLPDSENLKKLRSEFVFDTLVLLGFWSEEKPMNNPDEVLENVVERELTSVRVGKRLFVK